VPATIRIRTEHLRLARAAIGLTTDVDLAARMGVHRATVNRILNRGGNVTGRFVTGLLAVFPNLTFEDLFEVEAVEAVEEPDDEPSLGAA
jgi:transcriptional regulator with XRE-family HTH domain